MHQQPHGQWNGPGPGPGYGSSQPDPGYNHHQSYGEGGAPPYQPPTYQAPPNPHSELSGLKDDAQLWLMVGAAGFWLGFGWITGPLSWYFAAQIRNKFRALGHHPSGSANWAWGIGIATTLITYLAIVGVVLLIVFFVAGFAAFGT